MENKLYSYLSVVSESEALEIEAMEKRLKQTPFPVNYELFAGKSRWEAKTYSVNIGHGFSPTNAELSKTAELMAKSKPSYLWSGHMAVYFLLEKDALELAEEAEHGIKTGLLPELSGINISHTPTTLHLTLPQLKIYFKVATGGWASDEDMRGSIAIDQLS